MARRVKRLPHRWNGLDAELSEHVMQLLQREIDAFDQTFSGLALLCRFDRPLKIIDDRQQFLEESLVAEPDLVPLIPLGIFTSTSRL